MNRGALAGFIFRATYAPLWVRWAVYCQFAVGVLLGCSWASRFVTRQVVVDDHDWLAVVCFSVLAAALGTAVSLAIYQIHRVRLTPGGIRLNATFLGRNVIIRWDELSEVHRHHSLWLGSAVQLITTRGTRLVLPTRVEDEEGLRYTLERFAGPDHPLTLAMAEVVEGRR